MIFKVVVLFVSLQLVYGMEKDTMIEGSLKRVICPGGRATCPEGDTCCRLQSGEWGCCPLPNAVCCSDNQHCCPSDFTCTSIGCSDGFKLIPFQTKIESVPVKEVRCDASHYCPDGNTCCRLGTGEWGCCPVPNAICCDDHRHCCPSGYTCNTGTGECENGIKSIPFMEKTKSSRVEEVRCDASHYCPDGTTCCRLGSGQWGCCPVPNAICCDDYKHCCPSGYTCNTGTGECENGVKRIPFLKKNDSLLVKRVICPHSQSYCSDGETCCRLPSGKYGCCPFPNAVCCSDGSSCCPSGYTCNSQTGACENGIKSIPFMKKTESYPLKVVRCDASHYCPDGTTCCRLGSGEWGCCPVPNAICCDDHRHCCPSGYTCNTGTGECENGIKSIPFMEKTKSFQMEEVRCDVSHYCPDGTTCCRLGSGEWGCCPVPNAVCCDDYAHCCPSGYSCNVGTGECTKGVKRIPFLKKTDSFLVKRVICPHSQSYCSDGETCCRLPSGKYGCCPFPNAVCCSDGSSCCPSGYTCNSQTGACENGIKSIPFMKKTESYPLKEVRCDASHYCPDGTTCCRLGSGEWGCCPVPNAICCDDHRHCCPSGYTCNTGTGECVNGIKRIPFLKKVKTMNPRYKEVRFDVKIDEEEKLQFDIL